MNPASGRASELFRRLLEQGEKRIDEMIEQGVAEELYLDYKQTATKAESTSLHQHDVDNYARAVAGFANSEGGIILWGVNCRNDASMGDIPTQKLPIANVRRFASWLESITSGCTIPPQANVEHHVIEIAGTGDGFLASYIPKSMFAPLQCILGKHKNRYLIRAGSKFIPTPHAVLAGMFGKRPTPNVCLLFQGGGGNTSQVNNFGLSSSQFDACPYIYIQPFFRNDGSVLVRDLYVNVSINFPGPKCLIIPYDNESNWYLHSVQGAFHSVSHESVRLAPAALINTPGFRIVLNPPFDSGLRFEVSFGCDASPVGHRSFGTTQIELREALDRFTCSPQNSIDGMRLLSEVTKLPANSPEHW